MLRKFSPSRTTRDLAVSSTLAIAASLAFAGTGARAQAFLATPTLVGGNASVTTGTNTTTVTVNSRGAVINWTPNDNAIGGGPIAFQNSGTTATFVNNPSSTADFAVLNNILPTDTTRAIQFNGTIVSQLQTLAGGSSTGGTVYFYTPGGILVGPSAVINVGNIGLTANPIAYDASGNFGATGSVINNGTQTVSQFGCADQRQQQRWFLRGHSCPGGAEPRHDQRQRQCRAGVRGRRDDHLPAQRPLFDLH
jgi:filamentous hemagglutinin family protein